MALFGRSKITEQEAAVQFVLAILMGVKENWADITASFKDLMNETEVLDSSWARFEFGVANLATQLQAVRNLFPDEQAMRIRDYVLQCLSAPELGATARESLEAYEAAWESATEAGELPFGAMAETWCRRLNLGPPEIPSMGEFIDPLFAMALGTAMTTAFPGWWKTLLATRRVVA